MQYLDFTVRVHSSAASTFVVSASSPTGDDRGEFSAFGLPKWTSESFFHLSPKAAEETGNQLFQALFPGSIKALFVGSCEAARTQGVGLCTKIFLDPRDSVVRPLQNLPWELLFWKEREEYLALNPSTPVVRSLPSFHAPRATQLSSSGMRVLAAYSAPPGVTPLNLQQELSEIDSAGSFEVVAWEARLPELREILRSKGPFNVFHFLGHGELQEGEGNLIFERPDGFEQRVPGSLLAVKLLSFECLRLVVLNACKTSQAAVTQSGSPFGGVASALLLRGFPAVLAMQQAISDQAAVELSRTFYRELAGGHSLEAALAETRQALVNLDVHGFEWAIPTLFLRSERIPATSVSPDTSPERAPVLDVKSAIELLRAGQHAGARQQLQAILSQHPQHERARLYDAIARMSAGGLSIRAILEIDAAFQRLCNEASDPDVLRMSRLALGVLRYDLVEMRRLKVGGISSSQLFEKLDHTSRTAQEKEIARLLRASQGARALFRI